jgi:hypothetical protein
MSEVVMTDSQAGASPMNIWQFFDIHWFLAFIAIFIVGQCALEVLTLCKLPFRSFMVAKHGWPQPPFDADGDIHYKDKTDDTEHGEGGGMMDDAFADPELMEILAAIEHERWSGWMRWMFDNWTDENIARWKTQMVTPYCDLPEYSKESDRKEVRKTLEAIKQHLGFEPKSSR